VRQLIRRLRTCEAGSGLVEYALLIAVVALGLVGVLRFFRNTTGGLTNRVSVSVSSQTGGGYGGGTGGAPGASPVAHGPATADADSSSAEPDSSSGSGGATAILGFEIP
jgi:Flp pilus assembly pilin Flp